MDGPTHLLPALLLATALLTGCGEDAPSRTWEQTVQGAYSAALSDDGQYSLVGSLNHGASLWRVADASRLYDWNHQAGQYTDLVAAAFAPDNRFAVTADPRTLVRWDVSTGAGTNFWTTPANVRDLAMAGDGNHVLMGLEDHSALFFNAAAGNLVYTFLHEGMVRSVDLNPATTHALTGSEDLTMRLWSLADGSEQQRWTFNAPVTTVALSPNAELAFAAPRGNAVYGAPANAPVAVYRVGNDTPLHVLYRKNPGITVARFSPDGSKLLVGNVNRTIDLWDMASGQRIKRWQTEARNPWRPGGTAILALGFRGANNYLAITGDGLGVELR